MHHFLVFVFLRVPFAGWFQRKTQRTPPFLRGLVSKSRAIGGRLFTTCPYPAQMTASQRVGLNTNQNSRVDLKRKSGTRSARARSVLTPHIIHSNSICLYRQPKQPPRATWCRSSYLDPLGYVYIYIYIYTYENTHTHTYIYGFVTRQDPPNKKAPYMLICIYIYSKDLPRSLGVRLS